jgi:hypothetical protein
LSLKGKVRGVYSEGTDVQGGEDGTENEEEDLVRGEMAGEGDKGEENGEDDC